MNKTELNQNELNPRTVLTPTYLDRQAWADSVDPDHTPQNA